MFDRIGRWWDAGEEIDIVAVGPDALALGECKWKKNEKTTAADLAHLKRKAALVRRSAQGNWTTEYYFLFSRAGFSRELVNQAKGDRTLLLFSLPDLMTLVKDGASVSGR